MTYDVEYLYIYFFFFAICISLVRSLFKSFAHFYNQDVFLLLNFKSPWYILDTSPWSDKGDLFCKVLVYDLSFLSPNGGCHRQTVLILSKFNLSNFSFSVVILVLYLNSHHRTPCHLGFLLCYVPGGLSFFCFTLRSTRYFELIFVMSTRSFSVELPLLLCQGSVDWLCVGLFLGSLTSSINLFAYYFINYTLVWTL